MLHLSQALFHQGKPSDAQTLLLEAVRLRPRYDPARLALADLFLRQGRTFDALPFLAEAAKVQPEVTLASARGGVQARPGDAIEHFKLANALASLNQSTHALLSLQTAIDLNTNFWEARYLLGIELAAQNRLAEAQQQFAVVVRQRPDYARAHLNFGVALAKQRRFTEAAQEFQEVLRLESTNQTARQYLQTLANLTNSPPSAMETGPRAQ